MNIEIALDIFQDISNTDLMEFNYLLRIISYKERYSLIVSDPEIFNTFLFDKLTNADKEHIQNSFTQAILTSSKPDCLICVNGHNVLDKKHFSLEESIKYLMQPFSIIVENSLNDSHFIKALIKCFDESGELQNHLDNLWLQFENSGGCSNITNFINGRLQFYQNKHKFFKCFVILDSDKRSSHETIDKYAKEKNLFNKYSIEYHIFEKRMMENYMTDDAIRRKRNNKNKGEIDAYLNMTPEQKDFYDIYGGFMKNNEPKKNISKRNRAKINKRNELCTLSKEVLSLYGDLSSTNFNHLKYGFKYCKITKREFPMLFADSVVVYKKNLEQRTMHQQNPDELLSIILKMKKHL